MEHPITPPPELMQRWINEEDGLTNIATEAARWGADQELEACCEWMRERGLHPEYWRDLRDARRPKPPSLKEQALKALEHLALIPDPPGFIADMDTIRQALEALPND
jgi:hypothetical protein